MSNLCTIYIRLKVGVLLATLFVASQVMAQEKDKTEWKDGELPDVKIELGSELEIVLPRANRNYEKIPPRPFEPITPPITYDFKAFNFQTPGITQRIRPLKLKQNSSDDIYNGYITLGYGNYATPYAEGFYNTGKDKNKSVGAHAWLTSSFKGPVDDRNSGSGNSGISVYGRTFGKVLSFSGKVGFENTTTHFYGYPSGSEVDRDTIRQTYNAFSLGGTISNTKNTKFGYELGGDFSYLADRFNAKETTIDLNFDSRYKISEESSIKFKANYFAVSRKDEMIDAAVRNLFQLGGAYEFDPTEEFHLHAGVIVGYENDSLGGKDLHVFPDLIGTYKLNPSVDVYASLTGGVDKVSLHSIYRENAWVAPNIPIFHTIRTFDFLVGLNARLGNKVEAHAGLSLANLKNQYFYINSSVDQSKFNTVYDKAGTKRTNLFGSLTYAQSEKAKFMVRADLFAYTTGANEITEAWHLPTYKVTIDGYYNIYNKILLTADLIMQGGMKAFDPTTLKTVNLAGAFDLNLRAEYLFSKSFSFFVQFNNITSNQYPLYLNYPVRGLQVLGGITWSF